LLLGWVRHARQQGLRAHHHPGDAIAALRRLLLDEGALYRAGLIRRAETFDRGDLTARQ
jgi:hypothetical protein